MKFSTKTIKENLKSIQSVGSSFCYIDVPNNKMYFSNDTMSLQLHVPFENVTDEKVFAIRCEDFLHIANYVDEMELTSNYKYKSKVAKGKFERNENFEDVVDSVKVQFDNSTTYNKVLTVDESTFGKFKRASIFVAPDDIKPSFRNLNIKDNKIFSSSDYRIYIDDIDIDRDIILSSDTLKFMFVMGVGTEIKSNENSVLLTKDNISVYISSMREVAFIPVCESKFQSRLEPLYETNKLVFDASELKNKLDFISFYAKENASNLTYFEYENGKCVLYTNDSNCVEVSCNSAVENEEGILKFPFNSLAMLNVIQKLSPKEITINVSKNPSEMLFILELSETERVILAKIKID